MVIFYKKWKKYNEFQLTKNKMDLNNRKMTNHPPSPDVSFRAIGLLMHKYFHFFAPNIHWALPPSETSKYHSVWLQEINSYKSLSPYIRTWEQQEWGKKETEAEGKKRGASMVSTALTKVKSWRLITTYSKWNNKHYMVVLYKILEKYEEIQLTKNWLE